MDYLFFEYESKYLYESKWIYIWEDSKYRFFILQN